jgi:EAL domain-containing protein (putative c-di-GMP-specific phosphodiesterase class I)
VTIYPFDDHNAEDILKNADMAMYKAKREGRGRYQFYIAELNKIIQQRTAIERDLRTALAKDQLRLHYQPQLDLSTGQVVGVEALLRWQHPERGDISPVEFIPVAESTGLIMPIGEWVLRTACQQARAWQDAGLPPVRVAINLSAVQFRHKNLHETITQALSDSRLDPCWLEVELTESLIMKDVRTTIETLQNLHELGVQISIDDFGTGYSSLSYLTRFPINKIKLDKSFVRDVDKKDGAAIAHTVITLGHSLNMKVMAEGVETLEQLRFLRKHACNEVQGYYFGRPMPASAIERMLASSLEELKARALDLE